MSETRYRRPAPEHTPSAVVDAVLTAFSRDDRERAVQTAFNFAAPGLRTQHEDLEGFDWYLANPSRIPLLEWGDHRRGALTTDGDRAQADVFSYGDDQRRHFEFSLTEQPAGKYEGCWMVTDIHAGDDEVPADPDETLYVEYEGERIPCEHGETLRDVLLSEPGVNPHNGLASSVNCGGSGVCGTCAVEVDGRVSEPTGGEKRRLGLPPHSEAENLRLACQTEVRGDVTVWKNGGFFGQDQPNRDHSPVEVTAAEYEGKFDYDVASASASNADES